MIRESLSFEQQRDLERDAARLIRGARQTLAYGGPQAKIRSPEVGVDSHDGRPERPHAITRRLSEITPEWVTWLSPGRIPLGKLTVLEGDPGLGKSTLALYFAARVTRGEGLPGDPPLHPAAVIVLTAEDGYADTVRPRCDAMRADCTLNHTCEGVRRQDGSTGEVVFPDPDTLETLERLIREQGATLVIVDPLTAYLGGAVDSFRDQDVRRALRPLTELAERTGAAILVVRHLRKAASGKAIHAGGGSIAIAGAARSVLLVDRDPEDSDRRVLAVVKSNLAAIPASLAGC